VIPESTSFKQEFLAGLHTEWQQQRGTLKHCRICSIYFGGGTPSLLAPKAIRDILINIKDSPLSYTQNIEVTLEANPEDVTAELMHAYACAGVNRVSIGIQSLDDSLLHLLTRRHSAQRAKEAVIATHKAGIQNISIDLMYDLPQQTLSSWRKTLDGAAELPIMHLSLYNLVIEPHTVFYKKKKTLALPDPSTSLDMYTSAVDTFTQIGFEQYEISAFAKNNSYSRHNVGYWTGRPFLGFGPSAFSYWNGKRFRNVAHLGRYCRLLKEGKSPKDFEEELSPQAKQRELLAIHLRLLDGVALKTFLSQHGPLDEDLKETLSRLEHQGLLKQNSQRVSLTKKGILFYDTVAAEII